MRRNFRSTSAALMIACAGLLTGSALAQTASENLPREQESAREDQPIRTPRRDAGPGRGDRPRMNDAGPPGAIPRRKPDGGPEHPPGPREMRMLDLRDMAGDLPRFPPPRRMDRQAEGPRSPFAQAPAAESLPPGTDRVIDLVRALAAPLDLTAWEVAPGIVMVAGSTEDQARLKSHLDQMDGLFRARHDVELIAASFPAAQSPGLGAEMSTGGRILARCRQRIAAGVPTTVNATDQMTYIAEWVPIVADNAVAYQPTKGQVSNGLECEVTLRSRPDPRTGDQTLQVAVTGEISSATIAEKTWDVAMPNAKTTLTVGLPRVAVRSIESTGPATAAATVIALVPGFDPAEVIAIAVRVDPK